MKRLSRDKFHQSLGGYWMRFRLGCLLLQISLALATIAASTLGQEPPKPDLAKVQGEAAGWLADLLRIQTVNPPGNELAAARYLAGVLEKEGNQAEALASAAGSGGAVARLQRSARI